MISLYCDRCKEEIRDIENSLEYDRKTKTWGKNGILLCSNCEELVILEQSLIGCDIINNLKPNSSLKLLCKRYGIDIRD